MMMYKMLPLILVVICLLATGVYADTEVVLVAENAVKDVLIPDGPVDANWTGDNEPFDDTDFNDATFISGKTGGVGYETDAGYAAFISYMHIGFAFQDFPAICGTAIDTGLVRASLTLSLIFNA